MSATPTLFGRLDRPASAVLFAGLGGACEGIRMATGTSPLAAVNHWDYAIRLHALNHPDTHHYPESVWDVPPEVTARGRGLDLLWLSPDCTHHSKALGARPRDTGRRALADSLWRWMDAGVRPRLVMLENVPEFEDWGPVDADGRAIKDRAGEDFRAWVGRLRSEGYTVEWRNLVAADYGAPTSRLRIYLVARRDGRPIVWPKPTHGPGRPRPWRTAAECIDLADVGERVDGRARPIVPNTLRRIAAAVERYGLPCLVTYYGTSIGQSIHAPLATVTTKDRFGLVSSDSAGRVCLRMLQPRELARAMGFPESYRLEGTKAEQVQGIGNAVCPDVAAALVRANL